MVGNVLAQYGEDGVGVKLRSTASQAKYRGHRQQADLSSTWQNPGRAMKISRERNIKNEDCSTEVIENTRQRSDIMPSTPRSL